MAELDAEVIAKGTALWENISNEVQAAATVEVDALIAKAEELAGPGGVPFGMELTLRTVAALVANVAARTTIRIVKQSMDAERARASV